MLSPHPMADKFPMREGEFILLLALFQSLIALSIDIMMPALGVISRDLALGDPNDRQLVIALFLLGGGIGSIAPGVLADRYGRKPVLMISLAAYIATSLACALVTDFSVLLALRVVQGLSTSSLMVLPMTIIRDRFSGDRMARAQSMVAMTFMIVPMLAPAFGQAIMHVAGWRAIFGVMAGLAAAATVWAAIRLPETLHPEFRQALQPRTIAGNMKRSLFHRAAAGYFLASALIHGAFLGFINTTQQLLGEHYGTGQDFVYIFGGMALMLSIGNFLNARIVERLGARRISHAALLVFIAVAFAQLLVVIEWPDSLLLFLPLMTAEMMLLAFMMANFQSMALQPFARIAGAAASAQASLRTVAAAVIGAIVGHAYNDSAVPLALGMAIAGVLSLALVLYGQQGRLFQRPIDYDET